MYVLTFSVSIQVERFSAEVQVTEARCFYGFQIAIEVGIKFNGAHVSECNHFISNRIFTRKCTACYWILTSVTHVRKSIFSMPSKQVRCSRDISNLINDCFT